MTKEELLNKAIRLNYGDEIPSFCGIYIVQQKKLHDSGYRLMYVIGHTDFDKTINDFHYYLISENSDVLDIQPLLEKLLKNKYDLCDIHLDIDRHGLIHIWTNSKKRLVARYLHTSSCTFEVIDRED